MAEDDIPERLTSCDCIHEARLHDPISGTCLFTNDVHGPCPCAAGAPAVVAALWAVHEAQKRIRKVGRGGR